MGSILKQLSVTLDGEGSPLETLTLMFLLNARNIWDARCSGAIRILEQGLSDNCFLGEGLDVCIVT